MDNTTHEPDAKGWTVVATDEHQVVVCTGCTCGDDDCGFSGTVYASHFVRRNG